MPEALIWPLTGARGGRLIVNNCAAAVVLALNGNRVGAQGDRVAGGAEIKSGDQFRLPDVSSLKAGQS